MSVRWLAYRPKRSMAIAMAFATVCAMGIVGTGTTRQPAIAAGYQLIHVDPCQTDRAMTCDTNPNTGAPVPHAVYVPARAPARPRLAVFFPGTGARPSYYSPVGEALAANGWYVIDLRYTTTVATEDACPNATAQTNPQCFRQFRSESVFGENVPDPAGHAYNYAGTHVDKANAVMNRLLKLVAYLAAHPSVAGPGWARFQDQRQGRCQSFNASYGACNLDWANVALGGHSQGAGVALYLAKFYRVDRVAMLSGPEDAYPLPGRTTVASWITEGHFATPASHIYGFTHRDDPFYARQTAAWAALHLPGPVATYAPAHPPLGSHRIITTVAPACPELGSVLAAHSATAVVSCVELPGYAEVWTSMFGPSSHN